MRTLRWAGELAVSEDSGKAVLGVVGLRALGSSPWLQEEDQVFIDSVLDALATPGESDYADAEDGDVIQLDAARAARIAASETGKDSR